MKLTSVTFKPSAERFPPIVAIDLDQLTPNEYVTLRNLGYDTQLSKITKRTFEEKWILCINQIIRKEWSLWPQ